MVIYTNDFHFCIRQSSDHFVEVAQNHRQCGLFILCWNNYADLCHAFAPPGRICSELLKKTFPNVLEGVPKDARASDEFHVLKEYSRSGIEAHEGTAVKCTELLPRHSFWHVGACPEEVFLKIDAL